MNPNPQKTPNAENEESLLAFWRDNGIFEKTLLKDAPAGEYNFFEGPPTANGRPGIHHVGARSFKDVIPRYKTMRGFRVNRKAGWDTHGLPVELQVEKALGLKSKKEIEQYGVAEFNRQCKESVWTYKDEWEKLTERMGYWLDMNHPYVTYENSYIEALWATVKRADERGHLYKDFKVLPWCTRCGTALSSHELNQPGAYKDVKDLSIYVKFKVAGETNKYIVAWTTTPWTLPGNVALAVGNDIDYVDVKIGDDVLVVAKERLSVLGENLEVIAERKGSELVGLQYEPLYPYLADLLPEHQKSKLPNAFKVYAADFVTTTDGTGVVHTAVMYGADDFDMGTKFELPKFHTVSEEGKFVMGTGFLEGRYVKEVDENGKPTLAVDIVNDLTERNLLLKKENYVHSYPHCWRCDTPLLYYARTSWYFAMSKLRDKLLAGNEMINWEPDHIKEGRFGEWLDGIKDWAISRDRYWGTPLPIWETGDKQKRVVIGSLDDVKKYAKKSGNTYFVMRHAEAGSNVSHTWDFAGDPENHITELGRSQVIESAQAIKDKKIDIIIHSPILRTTETAHLAAETIGFTGEFIIDPRLTEFNAGEGWQGKPLHDFLVRYKNYPERFTLENTDGGDTYRSVKKRVMEALYDYEKQYAGKNILIVSHGSPVLNMILGSRGMAEHETPEDVEKVAYPKNAEIRELDFVPLPHNENYELDFHKPYIDQVEFELDGKKLYRTPEVMDVWFDSGAMPIAQHHKLGEPVNFDPNPADYIAEGTDQTRGWFYTMHAVAAMMHDDPAIAYKNVVCMGLLLDANGQKMSKSRGNVVSPWEMFDKYGADVIRFWFYSVNQPGEPKNFDEKSLDDVNKKVFNPLRNVVSFYEMYPGETVSADPRQSPNVLDQWILALLDQLTGKVVVGLEAYQELEASRSIRDFIGEFSTWYIRRSRDRFKSEGEDRAFAIATTRYVLLQVAKVMAPFTPFVAEEIFQKMKNADSAESVHLETYPVAESFDASVIEHMQQVRDIVTLGLEARAKANVKVRQPLAKLSVASVGISNDYVEIIKDELNVKEVVFDDSIEKNTVVLDTEITDALRDEGLMRDTIRQIQDMRKTADLMPADRVTVYLADAEPAWFASFEDELMSAVGATSVVWGSGEAKIEKI